ncbi:MAG: cytochrome c biogenesis protein CcsA [Candidatus Thorarchaeota archaeon]|nr:cytochrome c biogenesis protein CcsA [Candidatus Thorarchaeota archaeon]
MDFGTILLLVAVVVGLVDVLIMLIGPKIPEYESLSFGMSIIAGLSAIGALLWMAGIIFGNQFQYDYVFQVTSIDSDLMLKISGIWAGQSGSLVFWSMLSFALYLGFRVAVRGYEDDQVAYRASIIMAIQAILVGFNAFLADPFRVTEFIERTDGLGLNPLLRTFWNAIHPPIVFIAYALILVPFAIKLAGFTVRSEERNKEQIPILDSIASFTTLLAWVMLSLGIVIGGYWAYIVLGWGGYWAWDPVETGSLIPWLLLTAYYHAKGVFRKNDVLRDSFLVFAYLCVLFATWVTRSGVLNSVHGFTISIISWSMLFTLVSNFIIASLITAWSGYRDIEDEEWTPLEESNKGGESSSSDDNLVSSSSVLNRVMKMTSTRDFSIKIALVGLLIITAISVIGILLPAVLNLQAVIINPGTEMENFVSVGPEFYWLGFYGGSFFLITSAYYCMDTSMITKKIRSILIVVLLIAGGILGGFSYLDSTAVLPTSNWIVNFLIPVCIGAVAYIVIVFARTMAGKERGPFTMRKMGRVMLHLGMILLILGVFMSENVIIESNDGYLEGDTKRIGPNIWLSVEEIDLQYFRDSTDFKMVVTLMVIEGDTIVGIGFAMIEGHPEWGSISHSVYLQSNALRDVFIAVTGFSQPLPNTLMVTLHAKVLPLVSFVWIGSFFMIMAMLPMVGIEFAAIRKAIREKQDDFEEIGDDEQIVTLDQ